MGGFKKWYRHSSLATDKKMSYTDYQLACLARDSYTSVPEWDINGNQVAVTRQVNGADSETVIAFRGTEVNLGDWLHDIDLVGLPDLSFGMVHTGFLSGARDLYAAARSGLYDTNFVLTGHSLGGALALVFGALMLKNSQAPRRIVTFGAPRVGMSMFCRLLKDVEIREYRCGNDPVPEVPSWPFQHVVSLTNIGNPATPSLKCHFIGSYIAALAQSPPPTSIINV